MSRIRSVFMIFLVLISFLIFMDASGWALNSQPFPIMYGKSFEPTTLIASVLGAGKVFASGKYIAPNPTGAEKSNILYNTPTCILETTGSFGLSFYLSTNESSTRNGYSEYTPATIFGGLKALKIPSYLLG